MILDRLLAICAFALLTGFLGVLMWKVPHWDLIAVCLAALSMAFGDFFVTVFRRRTRNGD